MDEKLVTIACYFHSLRAYLTKGRLESEGIECWLFNENADYSPHRNPEGDIELRVKEGDVHRAREILHEIQVVAENEEFSDSNPRIDKILVPIDFSDSSPNLALIAAGFAGNFGAQLHLFHTYFVPAIDIIPVSENSVYPVTLDDHIQLVEASAREKMDKLTGFIKTQTGKMNIKCPQIITSFSSGFAGDEIVSRYEELEPNLIIMGTGSNEKGIDPYGSVTAHVIEKVKVPVLTIPSHLHYLDLKSISNVMYATNFDSSDFRAIHKLIYLTSSFKARIHFVHIRSGKKDEWDEIKLEGLKEKLKREFVLTDIEVQIIDSESIIAGFEDYVLNREIDIISLTTRKRNFLSRLFNPGVTRQLLLHAQKPILVFH